MGDLCAYQYWEGVRSTNYALPKDCLYDYACMLCAHYRAVWFDSTIAYNALLQKFKIIGETSYDKARKS